VVGTKETLWYDITSLGFASELINMLEYGYSKDDDGLPQVNFGLIVDRKRGLPGYYKLFPGSITDVSTYKNMQADLLDFQITSSRLIMDRGFFKPSNVRVMADKGFEFVIAMPFRYKTHTDND
jgi:transposase